MKEIEIKRQSLRFAQLALKEKRTGLSEDEKLEKANILIELGMSEAEVLRNAERYVHEGY